MALLYGLQTLFDSDREFVNVVGQQIVYEHVTEVIERWNRELQEASALFVSGRTQDFKMRFKLPGGGHLQRTRQQSGPGAVKAVGGWDVAFPLEEFGTALATDEVDLAYMTGGDLSRHMSTVLAQATNTYRYEMLRAILNNTQDTFVDERKGNLLIEPLANGDAVVYPPVLGAEAEAVEDHYLATNYAVASIAEGANNPLIPARDELEEHFGTSSGGENIVAICAKDVSDKLQSALTTSFTAVPDQFIRKGDNADIPVGLPSVPGKIVGRSNGVWVAEWRWLPSNYMITQHLEEEPPLMERTDEAGTGLPAGFGLVARDEIYPLEKATYRWRFGLGCANRLNGVVTEVTVGATYDVPAGY